MAAPFQDELLARHLRAALPDLDDDALGGLRERLAWVELPAGATLMAEGEPGDAMYLAVSGRLRASVRDADGRERVLREMGRGEVIGEMALLAEAPRSATVVALRDSLLVRLDKAGFAALMQARPQAMLALSRRIVQRLQTAQQLPPPARPVALALLPVSAGVDAAAFAQRFAEALSAHGSVCRVDADALDAALGTPGLARGAAGDAQAERRIALHLDALEAAHDCVLLVADAAPTPWTARCSRRADELMLLADATQPPQLHASEAALLVPRAGQPGPQEVLVLLHPDDRRHPQGTAAWLARRPVAEHLHVRPGVARDMARLARVQTRNAVGLVLAGGGARGLAHLGVYRALQEAGIEIDHVGGTSIGAVMAALVASGQPAEDVTAVARRAFMLDPTGDYNLLPFVSLIRGRRLRRVIEQSLQEQFGAAEAAAEDLWKPWFAIASNYSQAREVRVAHGPLGRALRASAAIPGALPPVPLDGDLLCDGGTFNNFPVDVMRARHGVRHVIGVDLGARPPRRLEFDEIPSPWALLRDRLRPRAAQRYRLPSLVAYLMNVTILYSSSRRQQASRLADLVFSPPLERVGMLQWKRFDSIVEQGHAHAREVLAALPPALRAKLAAQR